MNDVLPQRVPVAIDHTMTGFARRAVLARPSSRYRCDEGSVLPSPPGRRQSLRRGSDKLHPAPVAPSGSDRRRASATGGMLTPRRSASFGCLFLPGACDR